MKLGVKVSPYDESDYREKLNKWSKQNPRGLMSSAYYYWHTLFFSTTSDEFVTQLPNLNYAENIATYLYMKQLDVNRDGILSAAEIPDNRKEVQLLTENYLNLLTTFKVVGAMTFSLLFHLCVSNFSISSESVAFFGETTTIVFKYIFITFINATVMLSLSVIFKSIFMYKHLGFWMPTARYKILWMQQFSVIPVVIVAQTVLITAAVSIPFGAAAAISPVAGAISSAMLLLFSYQAFSVLKMESISMELLHKAVQSELDGSNV